MSSKRSKVSKAWRRICRTIQTILCIPCHVASFCCCHRKSQQLSEESSLDELPSRSPSPPSVQPPNQKPIPHVTITPPSARPSESEDHSISSQHLTPGQTPALSSVGSRTFPQPRKRPTETSQAIATIQCEESSLTSTSAETEATDTQSQLFQLPGEIRDMIYHYIIGDSIFHIMPVRRAGKLGHMRCFFSSASSCKLVVHKNIVSRRCLRHKIDRSGMWIDSERTHGGIMSLFLTCPWMYVGQLRTRNVLDC